MHDNAPLPRKKFWQQKLERSGFFLCAVLFHLILFLLIATVVIWKPAPPPEPAEFQGAQVKVPPPAPQPPPSGAAAHNPNFEPEAVVVPVVTPPSVVAINQTSAFNVDAPKILDQTLNHLMAQAPKGTGLDAAGGGSGIGPGNGFGSTSGTSAQMSGYFYDFKQTAQKKPTRMTEQGYLDLLAQYIKDGWDDSKFSPYYRSQSPLYTDTLAISTRASEEAPKAFGVGKEVQAGLWAVHYHARVTAPQAGDYRFAGFADNVMVVKIRGDTVFDGGWSRLTTNPEQYSDLPAVLPSYARTAAGAPAGLGADPHIRIGSIFHMEMGEHVDMDVLIGDCGGVCSFFLLIEQVGNHYEKTKDGTPELPFFQLDNHDAPTFGKKDEYPPYSPRPEPWQGGDN